jgi:hypothetical protein
MGSGLWAATPTALTATSEAAMTPANMRFVRKGGLL